MKPTPLDAMQTLLFSLPKPKRDRLAALVKTHDRGDLVSMRTQAMKDDDEAEVTFYDAAVTLRAFYESGILRDLQ